MIALLSIFPALWFYAWQVPRWRGQRGRPRYTAYASLPGLWLGSLLVMAALALHLLDPWGLSVTNAYYHELYFVRFGLTKIALYLWSSVAMAVFFLCFERIVRAAYRPILAGLTWGLWMGGIALIMFPQIHLMSGGVPSRYVFEPDAFYALDALSYVGAVLTLLSLAVLSVCVIEARIAKRSVRGRSTPGSS